MDEDTVKLLETWNFQQLIDVFRKNEVTLDVFKQMTPEILKELIPAVTLRVKFKQKWSSHFQNLEENNASKESDAEESEAENSVNHYNSKNDKDSKNEYLVLKKQKDLNLQSLDIMGLIQNSSMASSYYASYEEKKLLSRKAKDFLVDLIMSAAISSKPVLKSEDFLLILEKFMEIFPTENPNIYYKRSIEKKKSKTGKSVAPKGKFYNKYRNYRSNCNKIEKELEESEDSVCEENNKPGDEEESESVKLSIEWLKTHRSPKEEVLTHWSQSASARQRERLNKEYTKICDVYKNWPVLRDLELAITLINLDFELMNVTKVTATETLWTTFFNDIRSLKLKTKKSAAFQANKEALKCKLNIDTQITLQLLMLHEIVSPTARIPVNTKDCKQWKPSIQESKDSMICYIQDATSLDLQISKQKEAAEARAQPLQPFIIVQGTTITNITASYVVVDNVTYPVASTLTALDFCFKIFHVFHAVYPKASERLWTLIQTDFYNFKTEWDTESSSDISSDLKNKRKFQCSLDETAEISKKKRKTK